MNRALILLLAGASTPGVGHAGVSFDVVSPSNCDIRGGRLRNCRVDLALPEVVAGPKTRIPLQSEFRFSKSGDCRTQFPASLRIKSPDSLGDKWLIPFLSGESVVFRRPDLGSIAGHRITLDSDWIGSLNFDESCRIQAELSMDLPAVSGEADALRWVAELDSDLGKVFSARAHLRELILLRSAFQVLWEVADAFRVRLDGAATPSLLGDVDEAVSRLEAISEIESLGLSLPEKELLERLISFLPTLRASEDWRHRTLADFFPQSDQRVIRELVERLRSRTVSVNESEGRPELAGLEGDILGLCREARLMGTQLEPWGIALERLGNLLARYSCVP